MAKEKDNQRVSGDVLEALDNICKSNGGILQPTDVVKTAEWEKSPLHPYFEWDDSIAAQNHRIWQARKLIRVVVDILPGTEVETNVYVSLMQDRISGDGYRPMVQVLADSELRKLLLADALRELSRIQAKYSELKALAPVFAAIDELRQPVLA